ncbi:poly(ADP-ribose) glycohydrolase-like [Carcharodon carcharias]|uniref:poly(ADP-ribose) glycohydrolase-like n=1 Tax=Carcharodon carcharias TaxID=13397 RepID=UPI001B7E4C0A|nr:poly(ADP-ribose) glycohydrolase-like [Carcharodon carcharias]
MSTDRSKGWAEESVSATQPGWVLPSENPHSSGETSLGAARQEEFGKPAPRPPQLPPLKPSANHTVCVEESAVRLGKVVPVQTANAAEFWKSDYVKMPFSNHSRQTRPTYFMHRVEVSRWMIIKAALNKDRFETSKDLENAIKEYNQKYAHLWRFSGLHKHFDQLSDGERQYLLGTLLPGMAKLALQLPKLCSKPIPLLKQSKAHAITMSQEQIACLLANAFFCTFPHRNSTQPNSEYRSFPDINFSRLFANFSQRMSEKLKTIFCYFSKVTENMPKGLVTFQRCCLNDSVVWRRSPCKLTQLRVSSEGRIEEEEQGELQVDFASPMVGGGVLGSGLVQEEIRFLINPELIVARLFTEKLADNECLVITGAQRYSEYGGYSDSYRWLRYHNDETPRDSWLRLCTEIVAIDALNFRNPMDQYKICYLDRELNKAYCGFSTVDRVVLARHRPAIATGNWGCGAFKGDAKLKALIQLMAAAQAQRDVVYFTFGDTALMRSISEMHQVLQRSNVTVGQLYNVLAKYSRTALGVSMGSDLYEFIRSNVACPKGRI